MYQLHVDRWYQLGVQLRLTEDQLEEAKKSPHPTAAVLIAAKVRDIDLRWVHIVEALLLIGENELAEKIFKKQGKCVYVSVHACVYQHSSAWTDRSACSASTK